jgi:hypothetical protein
MNKNLVFLIFPLMLLLGGCARLQQDYIEQTCNTDAAYAAGVNDAKNNIDMQTNYAGGCPANVATLNDSYRRGYQFSLAQVNSGTLIYKQHIPNNNNPSNFQLSDKKMS